MEDTHLVVVLTYNQKELEDNDYTLDGEMGWVAESGIYMSHELGEYKDYIQNQINLLTELQTALLFAEDTLTSLPDGEIIQEDLERVQDRLQEIEQEINKLQKEL